jgi:hypothetical protein
MNKYIIPIFVMYLCMNVGTNLGHGIVAEWINHMGIL